MSTVAEKPRPTIGYEADINLWGLQQARLLREERWAELDLQNLAEEMESLGSAQKSELRSRLGVLLQHLLKWQFQPEKRKYGWRATIIEQRDAIEDVLETSPSLKRYPEQMLERRYGLARMQAAEATGLPERSFLDQCPYALQDILRSGFYPGPDEHAVV